MTPTGDVTTINFALADIRANNVTLGLGPGGTLQAVFRSSTAGSSVHMIFDVTGYFLPNTSGAKWHAVTPGRILDTRRTGGGVTHIDPLGSGKFQARVVRNVKVVGVVGIGWTTAQVPSNATAVTGNVTVTNATANGYVSFGPTMVAIPATSTLNTAAGYNNANGITVALRNGNLQAVWGAVSGSTADVIFDVTGYFTTGTGQAYHPITPVHLMDSRTGLGGTHQFLTESPQTINVGGTGDIPSNAVGISGNLTVWTPTTGGFAFVGPVAVIRPPTSTLNTVAGYSVANGFDVKLSSTAYGKVSVVWDGDAGSLAHVTLDVTGYWL
jgi:hypothetical protein